MWHSALLLMKQFVSQDLKVALDGPTVIMEDNPAIHSITKHIDIRYHFVHEAVKSGTINVTAKQIKWWLIY